MPKFATTLLIIFLAIVNAGCRQEAWRDDADVRAAAAACNALDESERYTCLERHAVSTLNPDVCRLANKFVDDMCLQSVYEAADDATICDDLYLEGVRPNCEAYYRTQMENEQVTATVPTASPTASPTPAPCPDDLPEPTAISATGPLQVFFIENGNIRLWQETTGNTATLVDSGDVQQLTLSGDGQVIAFLSQAEPAAVRGRQSQMALWAVDSDGNNERQLISADELRQLGGQQVGDFEVRATNPVQLQWIPGSHRLAYRTNLVLDAQVSPQGPDIRLVNADTGQQSVLLSAEAEGSFTFSPDGQHMTISDDTGIDLLDIDGSNRYPDVVTYPHIGLGHVAFQARPVWAPDGRFFSVALPSADPFVADATLTVWRVVSNESSGEQLGAFMGSPLSATFSPDLSQIAFHKETRTFNAEDDLFIADVTGDWLFRYNSGVSIRFLGWARDRVHFAYAFSEAGDQLLHLGQLCQTPVVFEGPPVVRDTAVAWVDGERFLYLTDPDTTSPQPPYVLLLGSLDGSVQEIGTVADESNSYQYVTGNP